MLRTPNPGSDIRTFIRIFIELFKSLSSKSSFGLDDMTRVLIDRNLATSCGFMGEAALQRSTRDDRSRDPLYNQSKMYSELYKILGWINPTDQSALVFRFTMLGAHINEAHKDPMALFEECLLGSAFPNKIIDITTDCHLRPYLTLLRTIVRMDGYICRDELIIGPLSLTDDRSKKHFEDMIKQLQNIRPDRAKLERAIQALSEARRITHITMGNYTRFPLAALKEVGWTKLEKRKIYGRNTVVLELTGKGGQRAQNLENSTDIRNEFFDGLKQEQKASLVRLAFYQMLSRAGFDTKPVDSIIKKDSDVLSSLKLNLANIIFSPYQQIETTYTESILGSPLSTASHKVAVTETKKAADPQQPYSPIVSRVTLEHHAEAHQTKEADIIERIKKHYESVKDLYAVASHIKSELRSANKDTFYPFIAALFRCIGYNCEHSRSGINYMRWDALIIHETDSMPIEIKSPGEEEHLSVKAIRQALENKVILLSRKSHNTQYDTTTLAVGYDYPSDRSEVSSLISDIDKTFGIRIGLIDLHSLIFLAATKLIAGKAPKHSEFSRLKGFIYARSS